jgi:hypothetical protein
MESVAPEVFATRAFGDIDETAGGRPNAYHVG